MSAGEIFEDPREVESMVLRQALETCVRCMRKAMQLLAVRHPQVRAAFELAMNASERALALGAGAVAHRVCTILQEIEACARYRRDAFAIYEAERERGEQWREPAWKAFIRAQEAEDAALKRLDELLRSLEGGSIES